MPEERRLAAGEDLAHGVPPVAVSSSTTLVNRTGSWKYIRPVLRDRVAPCNQGCPVGIDIEACMDLLREGRVAEALGLLLLENPMPAVTGRVCHHPCELACNRGSFDEPVAIHAVERMLGDLSLRAPLPAPAARTRRESVAVVGSGPAGLACAYHLLRLGYGVTILEADAEPGGVLRYGVPEYRLPKQALAREIERIKALGARLRCGVRVGADLPWADLERFDAVFVATGAPSSQPVGLAAGRAAGVRSGLEFLREVNSGRRPSLGPGVIVVGGGNTAMDCARTALRLGSEALVLYRRGRAEMPAIAEEVEEAEHEGVRFLFHAAPAAARLREGRLVGLDCIRLRPGEPDASGRPRPVPVEGGGFFLQADAVLTAAGERPDMEALPEDLGRGSGGVVVDPLGATARAGTFAGGDVAAQPRTVAHALGSGKRAAVGIDRYLRRRAGEPVDGRDQASLRFGLSGNVSMARWSGEDPVRRNDPVNEVIAFDALNADLFLHVNRHVERRLASGGLAAGFEEVNEGLTHEAALAEAARCFNCGVCNQCEVCIVFCPDLAIARRPDGGGLSVAYDYCKGCGICSAECPRGAITMTRQGP